MIFQSSGFAQTPVAGTQLEIGAVGSNQVYNSATLYSGAIGSGNSVVSSWSLAVGYSNTQNASSSLLVGGNNSAVSGEGGVALIGTSNSIVTAYDNGDVSNSLAVGSSNMMASWGEYGANADNMIMAGASNFAAGDCSATFGRSLNNHWPDCTVVGKFNAYAEGSGLLFVVGNGNGIVSNPQRFSNAVEVYNDGSVVIPKRQGDIPMGEFGLGGD